MEGEYDGKVVYEWMLGGATRWLEENRGSAHICELTCHELTKMTRKNVRVEMVSAGREGCFGTCRGIDP